MRIRDLFQNFDLGSEMYDIFYGNSGFFIFSSFFLTFHDHVVTHEFLFYMHVNSCAVQLAPVHNHYVIAHVP